MHVVGGENLNQYAAHKIVQFCLCRTLYLKYMAYGTVRISVKLYLEFAINKIYVNLIK